MRILLVAVAALLCCPAAAALAGPWAEAPVHSFGEQPVSCLGPAGEDRVAVTLGDEEARSVDVLRVASDGGLEPETSVRLGITLGCPTVAGNAAGATVVAALAPTSRGRRSVVVTARDAGGGFGRPRRIDAPPGALILSVAAAVAPNGAAVVAWTEIHPRNPAQGPGPVRVIRRGAGGMFGAPETLREDVFGFIDSAVGIDAAGRATVAWARISSRADFSLEVASAPPGAPFGRPQRLAGGVEVVNAIALAVAPDGHALLAHDGGKGIGVFEREPGAALFTSGRSYPWERQRALPVVALGLGGAAIVAWQRQEGAFAERASLELALRPPGGAFQPPQVLSPSLSGWSSLAPLPSFVKHETEAAQDAGRRTLGAAIGDDGSVALTWLEAPVIGGGDAPGRVALAAGTVAGGLEGAALLGGPGRSADAVALLPGASAALWTDNLRASDLADEQAADGSGRLHRALPGIAAADAPPPTLSLRARNQRVREGEPVIVGARCSAACDLRAVAGRDYYDAGPAGFAAASLGGPGEARLALRAEYPSDLVQPEPLIVTVHATAPGGREAAVERLRVRVRRAPVPLPRRPRDIRTTWRGDRLVVRWSTARPARAETFRVLASTSRAALWIGRARALDVATVRGRGRTSFRAVLDEATGARWLKLEWESTQVRLGGGHRFVRVPPR